MSGNRAAGRATVPGRRVGTLVEDLSGHGAFRRPRTVALPPAETENSG